MEKIIFFLDKNNKLTKTEKELIEKLNEVLSTYNDLKNDLFKKDDKILDFDFIREWFDYDSKSNCLQFEFTNDLKIQDKMVIDTTNKLIPVHNIPTVINMEIGDFCEFIKGNNISTIFVDTKINTYFHLFLEELLGNFNQTEEEKIVCNILQKYIQCYNSILKKLDIEALTEKRYFCVFNSFAFGCVETRYSYYLNQNYILSAIALMCKDEINERLELFESIQKQKEREERERLEKEQRERAKQTNMKMAQLEERILNDENFAICRSEKDRLKYLRIILQDESYEVITYLEMELMSTGIIRARGIKGKLFINRLWDKLNNRA